MRKADRNLCFGADGLLSAFAVDHRGGTFEYSLRSCIAHAVRCVLGNAGEGGTLYSLPSEEDRMSRGRKTARRKWRH